MSSTNNESLEGGRLLPLVEDFYTIQGEGFHAGKPADNGVYFYHSGNTKGQNHGDDGREAFGYGGHSQGNGSDQHFQYIPLLEDCNDKEDDAQQKDAAFHLKCIP